MWDVSTLTHTHTLDVHTRAHRSAVTCLALTQDEQHLVSCSDERSLKVWSLSCLRTVQLDDYPSSLAVSQPGDVVVVRRGSASTLFRLSTGECVGKVDSQGDGVALSLCGRWVFTPTNGNASVSVCAVSSAH